MSVVFNPFTGTFDFTGSGGGGGGTPGSPDTSVQFNSSGSFAGNANFLFDATTYVTPVVQQLASALVVGNTAAALGAAPDQGWGLYVGDLTFAGGGSPPIQFDQSADGSSDVVEDHFIVYDPAADVAFNNAAVYVTARFNGTHNYTGVSFYQGPGALTAKAQVATSGTVNYMSAVLGVLTLSAPTITNAAMFTAFYSPNQGFTGHITTLYGMYVTDFGGSGGFTNGYPFWADEQGVFRIRADNTFNSVYQAIPALYNPQFTKYTPGAVNYERIVQQWESNVATITTEAGGTGTLRALNLGDAGVSVTANSIPVVTTTATQTLTNKRITKRVTTAADATSITPNSDSADVTYQANTQGAGTLTINADAGTPTNGQSWLLKVKCTNAQTVSWNTIYVGGAIPLPTATTGSSKIDYFAFVYDSVTPKWDYTGTATGF